MKTYKVPRGFTRLQDEPNAVIEDGAIVYLDPAYVREDESPKKYVVMETPSGGTFLLADNKRMYNNAEGYLYSKWSIAYFKNPQ